MKSLSERSTSKKEKFLEYKIDEYQVRNFCKNYRLNDIIKEETFNKKYSHPDFVHVFFPENDYTKKLFKAIDFRIADGNNAVFIIHGEPHLGKSEFGQALGKYIEKRFKELLNKKSKLHIGFSTMEFERIIREMKNGDIGIRDESPKGSGKGSQSVKDNLNNITQIVRKAQNFFIFICPKKIEADVVTYYFEAAGKNKNERKLRFIIYDPSYRDGKIPIGRVFVRLHEDEAFREEYERLKDKNIELLKKRGGGVYHQIDRSRLEKDHSNLVEYCKKSHVKTHKAIEAQLVKFNHDCEQNGREEDIIGGSLHYMKVLLQGVYDELNKKKKKNLAAVEPTIPNVSVNSKSSGFSEFLRNYYQQNLPDKIEIGNKLVDKEDIIETLESWALGVGIRDISHSSDHLHQGLVVDIIKLFKDGKRNSTTIPEEFRLYSTYEHWCAQKYNLELVSGHNQPDFYLHLENKKIAGEIKLWDDVKTNIALDKRKKFHVSNNFKDKQTSFPVLWRNVKWGDHDYFFDVSMNGDNIFNFEKKEQHILENLENKEGLKTYYKNIEKRS